MPKKHKENKPTFERTGRFRLTDGGTINYEIIGQTGPWVAAISSGRSSSDDIKGFSQKVASRDFQVVIHDRRNCGESSLVFDSTKSEDDLWADDLFELLVHLNATPVYVVGLSRGTRVAIKLIQRHPNISKGLMLWGLSGGSLAVRFLDEYYYGQYLRACRAGGMEEVCALDYFANLIEIRPDNRDLLLSIDPAKFILMMNKWREAFLQGKEHSVMGVSDEALRKIDIPTTIVPYYDKLHPRDISIYAQKIIPNSRFFDFDPFRSEKSPITRRRKPLWYQNLTSFVRSSLGETLWQAIRSRVYPQRGLDEAMVAEILHNAYKDL